MFSFTRGDQLYPDITEVTLEVRLAMHCRKAGDTLIDAAFPKLYFSLLFNAGHGIECSRKIQGKLRKFLINHRFFLYSGIIIF